MLNDLPRCQRKPRPPRARREPLAKACAASPMARSGSSSTTSVAGPSLRLPFSPRCGLAFEGRKRSMPGALPDCLPDHESPCRPTGGGRGDTIVEHRSIHRGCGLWRSHAVEQGDACLRAGPPHAHQSVPTRQVHLRFERLARSKASHSPGNAGGARLAGRCRNAAIAW